MNVKRIVILINDAEMWNEINVESNPSSTLSSLINPTTTKDVCDEDLYFW